MISLVLATKKDIPTDFSKSTLLGKSKSVIELYLAYLRIDAVVPLSILSNWEKQLQDHCTPGAISYCTYYDKGRAMSAKDLERYDIVITTYQTVANEVNNANMNEGVGASQSTKRKKTESSLFGVKWKVG